MDEMQELIKEFFTEAEEILECLDQHFIKLEGSPGDLMLINEIFRGVHSIKGSAGFLGFNRLVEVAHQSENLLNKLRQQELQASTETIDIVLESVDVLKGLLKEVKDGSGVLIDIGPIKRKLGLLLDFAEEVTPPSVVKYQSEQVAGKKGEDRNQKSDNDSHCERSEGSACIERSEKISKKDCFGTGVPRNDERKAIDQEKDQTLRVDTDRLDHVMDLVGELVLSRNRLSKILYQVEEQYDGDERIKSLLETVSSLNLITTDLQLSVMKMRMVPIRKVFNKFPRMVRDLARKVDKKINLRIYGESTEVDKSVIEVLADPLIHIIRNSIDHGIEQSEERQKKGKSGDGTITLGAFQEGNYIIIQVEDDGKGMDPVLIEKKAREKGLIKSQDLRLTPKEIINFIFEPGFSTADKVTDISGRGVGMDVVKTNISRINGIIDVSSEIDKGTILTLKIPLTLAIIQVLMVKINGEIYALPLSSILETVRISRDDIKSIDGQEIISLRDRLIPLIRLGDVLDINGDDSRKGLLYVVLMAVTEKRVGIIVDELCHQEEVVIKSVGTYFSDIKEISGATITEDGKVGLILDPGSLIYKHKDLVRVSK